MDYISLKPRAKINISLDCIGLMPNKYHEVETIMQTIKLHDDLLLKKTMSGRIDITTNNPDVPTDENNLVYKACELIRKQYNITGGLFIELTKRIPVAAGLGGGSSDAAAALLGLRQLYELNATDDELATMGKKIGSDVPFFIYGGTALAKGKGDILTLLPKHPFILVLICKPDFYVSTAHVYENLLIESIKSRPDTAKIVEALREGDLLQILPHMQNVLETVTEKENPIITEIKQTMLAQGALCALMSGSGPAVFGYYTSHKDMRRAAEKLRLLTGYDKGVIQTSIF